MKVELMYEPGSSIRRVLDILETAIAEEQLPIPVELVENGALIRKTPVLRIDGQEFGHLQLVSVQPGAVARLEVSACLDQIRSLLAEKWRELTKI